MPKGLLKHRRRKKKKIHIRSSALQWPGSAKNLLSTNNIEADIRRHHIINVNKRMKKMKKLEVKDHAVIMLIPVSQLTVSDKSMF